MSEHLQNDAAKVANHRDYLASYQRFNFSSPPTVLHHYTSMEGLIGIVESEKIWASDSRYLNDATDCIYILDALKRHISTLVANGVSDHNFYREVLDALGITRRLNIFIASFSANPDSLSQWRAYSGRGVGFSIGFDSESLRAGALLDSEPNDLLPKVFQQFGKVTYPTDNQDELLDEILKASQAWARSFFVPFTKESLPVSTGAAIAIIAPLFKHPKFKEECEWRLMITQAENRMLKKRFRVGKSTLVPYVEAVPRVERGYFIKEVIVGPSPHIELSIAAVKALFEEHDHPEVNVRTSDVPYRHW